jgi:hypothetical protein
MIRRHGRVYVSGTAEGFQRMREKGIPQPSLRREDLLARTIAIEYQEMFDGLIEAATTVAKRLDLTVQRTDKGTVIVRDAPADNIIQALSDLIGEKGPIIERIRRRLNIQLVEEQKLFLKDLLDDADPKTIQRLKSMSIPSAEVFAGRLEDMRELYLNDAVKRIIGESDLLKKSFLSKLTAWAEGETKTLQVTDVVQEMRQTSARRARFFARDQFSRFNRSLMVASYTQANADYIEVITAGDSRVRPMAGVKMPEEASHRAWNHKIFTRQGLLADPRYSGKYSHLCRCGFVPVYAPLTNSQRTRLVA